MNLTESIAPRSDQINSDDLIPGPITYTVREVREGAAESPFDFMLVETDRAYRPSKTMRRVIVAAWGAEASQYAGRRLTLYREPTIKFGGQTVGGIRVSHMSNLPDDKPVEVMAQVTRGQRERFVVQPLPDAPPPSAVVSADLLAELTAIFDRKGIADNQRLNGVHRITGSKATALDAITEDEARQVLTALEQRPDMTTDEANA